MLIRDHFVAVASLFMLNSANEIRALIYFRYLIWDTDRQTVRLEVILGFSLSCYSVIGILLKMRIIRILIERKKLALIQLRTDRET